MLVAEGDVEGCDGAWNEEPSDDDVASAVFKDMVFPGGEARKGVERIRWNRR